MFDKLVLPLTKCSKDSSEKNLTLRFPLFLGNVFKILPSNAGKTTNRLQDSSWFHLRAMPWAALSHIKLGTSRLLWNCPPLHLKSCKEKALVVHDALLVLNQEIALYCLISMAFVGPTVVAWASRAHRPYTICIQSKDGNPGHPQIHQLVSLKNCSLNVHNPNDQLILQNCVINS